MGNIRNPENFFRAFWDWEFLNDCFTSGIKVSDLDGIVERRGFFLVFETKSKGAPSLKGQRILMEQLVKTGYFTVIYVWGDNQKPEDVKILAPYKWGEYNEEIKVTESKSSVEHLKTLTKAWFNRANSYPRK